VDSEPGGDPEHRVADAPPAFDRIRRAHVRHVARRCHHGGAACLAERTDDRITRGLAEVAASRNTVRAIEREQA
jgi:hypothetical protein